MPIRVLVVDDSAVVRKALSEGLSRYPDIEVVGTAIDPYVARDKIIALRPDVVTLDVEMPRMDGLSFLERLMQHYPLPVIIVSSLTPKHSEAAVRALALGAVDVVPKPGTQYSVPDVERHLVAAVRAASRARLTRREPVAVRSQPPVAQIGQLRTTDRLIAIGASTGGTGAIEHVLRRFPANAPGTVITQHMPAGFTASFANRLDQQCAVTVREARDGEVITPGLALIAPGNYHLLVQRSGAQWIARVKDGPLVHHQRPAVDVMFQSVAKAAGRNAVGAILTGMGEDGARGMLSMRGAGAWTIAQDEATSVVFGMPRAAIEMEAACEVRALDEVAEAILSAVSGPTRTPLAVPVDPPVPVVAG
ncbi:MAG: chemotaxis response regulator protein-glutamate methylesterase [Gemmatimonadaceae bacterium]|nr:chemotaxis response regulator protein-glutamate methylesterase [Gemmatimonadaceae bacterium]